MNNIPLLMIAYGVPPAGGTGVHRTAKFVKYLSRLGWLTTIVAPSTDTYRLPREAGFDPRLVEDLPASARVVRTRPIPGERAEMLLRRAYLFRVFRTLAYPLAWERAGRWYWDARRAAQAEIERERPRVLYSSAPPYTTHRVALALHSEHPDLVWVADFRDLLVRRPGRRYPSRRAHRWEQRVEREIASFADAMVVNTEAAAAVMSADHPRHAEKIRVIRNGFDPEDLPSTPRPKSDGAWRLFYVGAFGDPARQSPGKRFDYVPLGVAGSGRSVSEIVTALRLLRDQGTGPPIEFHHIGAPYPPLLEARSQGLDSTVHCHGVLPHDQALNLAHDLADAFYLPLERPEAGSRLVSAPGKLYEYLGLDRPIVVVSDSPEEEATQLAVEYGSGVWCPRDADSLAQTMRRLARETSMQTAGHTTRLQELSRPRQAEQLHHLFLELLNERMSGSQRLVSTRAPDLK